MITTRSQLNDFLTKVHNMRRLQKQYFKQRYSLTLSACKKAEKEVDDLLQKYTEKENQSTNLFE